MTRIGLITYAAADPFHLWQMEIAERSLRNLGHDEQCEIRRFFGNRDKAVLDLQADALAAWGPDLVLSFMTNADLAVLRATEAAGTPIVCWSMDPLASGLVASMARPGGRLTGVAFPPGLQMMQLRVLRTLKPATRSVAMLFNPGYAPARGALEQLQQTGALFGIEVRAYEALTLDAVCAAFPAMAADGCDGLVVGPHELFNQNGVLVGGLALDHNLPTIAMDNIVEAGGTYGFTPDFARIWQAAGVIGDRVLRGEPAGEIPIDRHIMPRTTLNLRAARTIGLNPSPALIEEADRVID